MPHPCRKAFVVLFLFCTAISPGHAQSPYDAWPNGPSADADYFPVGVWLQDPNLAPQYAAVGINLYVGLWQGPTQAQLDALSSAGMRTICTQNAVGLQNWDNPVIAGWLQRDEPDNIPHVPLDDLLDLYAHMQRFDPTRPVLVNFGQGVANRSFNGRGVQYSYYRQAVQAGDIVSFDIYPVSSLHSSDMGYVAAGVDSLVGWTGGTGLVWNFIETTRIRSSNRFKPTPQQVRAQVWLSLIHGSRGILYFVHEWEPRFDAARLLNDPPMLEAIGAINAQLHRLAPVLNSPGSRVTVESSSQDVPVDAATRMHDGYIYIFAAPRLPGATRATFQLDALPPTATAEVIDENRTIDVIDGHFADDFADYQVHLYRIALPTATAVMGNTSTPPPPSLAPNHPNPFNGSTTIHFHLPAATRLQLAVFNLAGQQIARLADGFWPAGQHTVRWDGRRTDGIPAASGVYLYRLQTEDLVQTRRLLLLR